VPNVGFIFFSRRIWPWGYFGEARKVRGKGLGKCAESAFIFFSTYGAFRSVSELPGGLGELGAGGNVPNRHLFL
jgi:hypothetical protein